MAKNKNEFYDINKIGPGKEYVKLVKIKDMFEAEKFKNYLSDHRIDYYIRHPESPKNAFKGTPPETEIYVKGKDYRTALSLVRKFRGKTFSEYGAPTPAKPSTTKAIIIIVALIAMLMGCGLTIFILMMEN